MLRKSSFVIGTIAVAALTACTAFKPSLSQPIVPTIIQPKVVVQVVPVPVPVPVVKEAPESKITTPYVGKTIDDVIKAVGQPIGSADMGDGVQAFQFQVKPKKPKCVVSYLAKRESEVKPWVVEEHIPPDPKTCN